MPPSLKVAAVYESRGIGLDRIPSLIERNARDTSARVEADANTDWIPEGWKKSNRLAADESVAEARLLVIRSNVRMGGIEEARRALGELEEHANRLVGSEEHLWAHLA